MGRRESSRNVSFVAIWNFPNHLFGGGVDYTDLASGTSLSGVPSGDNVGVLFHLSTRLILLNIEYK
jgi:hypothetical protein